LFCRLRAGDDLNRLQQDNCPHFDRELAVLGLARPVYRQLGQRRRAVPVPEPPG